VPQFWFCVSIGFGQKAEPAGLFAEEHVTVCVQHSDSNPANVYVTTQFVATVDVHTTL